MDKMPTNKEINDDAVEWVNNLHPRIMKNVAVGKVLLKYSHGDLHDFDSVLQHILVAAASGRHDPDRIGTMALIAGLAFTALEDAMEAAGKLGDDCGCDACTVRREIEQAAAGIGAQVKVHVFDRSADGNVSGLTDFLNMMLKGARPQG